MWNDVKRFFRALAIVIAVLLPLPYLIDARSRWHATDWESEVSPVHGGRYTAKYSYIAQGTALFRIYDTESKALLAERTFYYGKAVKPMWFEKEVIYSTSDDYFFGVYDGSIALPPTWFDRLMAQLP